MSVLKRKGGENELETRRTDIRGVIASAVETASAQVGERRQRLVVQLPEEPVAVEADSGRLEQAITSLLTNASSYSDSGSAIELEVTLEDGGIRIVVIDSGIGFDNEEARHLFDLFSRGNRARNHFANGLGIGVHLTREIVNAHGGRVTAHSEGPGRGSRFEIWLPVLSGDAHIAGPGWTNLYEEPVTPLRRPVCQSDNRRLPAPIQAPASGVGHGSSSRHSKPDLVA